LPSGVAVIFTIDERGYHEKTSEKTVEVQDCSEQRDLPQHSCERKKDLQAVSRCEEEVLN